MVCFVRKSLALLKIMSAIVENTKVFDTEELFVIGVVSRLQEKKYEEIEWVILHLLFL